MPPAVPPPARRLPRATARDALRVPPPVAFEGGHRPFQQLLPPLRTRELARPYEALLKDAGLPVSVLHEKSEFDDGPGIRVCTLHRAKGLEFHHVLLCALGDTRFPHPMRSEMQDDELAVEEHEAIERNLLFVGATRARETLW